MKQSITVLLNVLIVPVVFFAFLESASAAVSWTQHTTYDGNPGNLLFPSMSADGAYLFYAHRCQEDTCSSTNQDGGSVYRVRFSDGNRTRLLTGLTDGRGTKYVSSNENGNILALSSDQNLTGDVPIDHEGCNQVYLYTVSPRSFERVTNYECHSAQLEPNISADGNIVCWTSRRDPITDVSGLSQAYCYNKTTDSIYQITTGSEDETTFISPDNDGTRCAVASREPLAGPLPSGYEGTQQIYYSGNCNSGTPAWQRITLSDGAPVPFKPFLTKDSSKILFAQSGSKVDGGASDVIAFTYSFQTGLITRLFAAELPSIIGIVVNTITGNADGTKVAISSLEDLSETGVTNPSEEVFSGIYTPSDTTVQSGSPVDLVLTDPQDRDCSKSDCQIPGCTYFEFDFDGDGELNDRIWCDPRIGGNYQVQVIPDGTQQPGDTYSLIVAANDAVQLQITDQPVPENPDNYFEVIPSPQYLLNLRSSSIRMNTGNLRLRGILNTPAIAGPITLTVSGSAGQPTILNLGNTSTYKTNRAGTLMTTTIKDGTSTIHARFRKTRSGGWDALITGTRLNLSAFAGTTNLAITESILVGDSNFSATEIFKRRKNQDLVYND